MLVFGGGTRFFFGGGEGIWELKIFNQGNHFCNILRINRCLFKLCFWGMNQTLEFVEFRSNIFFRFLLPSLFSKSCESGQTYPWEQVRLTSHFAIQKQVGPPDLSCPPWIFKRHWLGDLEIKENYLLRMCIFASTNRSYFSETSKYN